MGPFFWKSGKISLEGVATKNFSSLCMTSNKGSSLLFSSQLVHDSQREKMDPLMPENLLLEEGTMCSSSSETTALNAMLA